MSALELRLADEALDRLLTWFPGLADPSDVEGDRETKRHGEDEDAVSSRAVSLSVALVMRSTVRYLRERDDQLASAGNQSVPLYQLIDAVSLEHGGRIHSGVAAAIGDPQGAGFAIELSFPLDMRWVGLLSGLTLRDRIRLLTEVVRVLGNVIRFAGLFDGALSDGIRILGEPVRLLRAAVRDARKNPSDESDGGRSADADPCSSDLFHAISVGEEA